MKRNWCWVATSESVSNIQVWAVRGPSVGTHRDISCMDTAYVRETLHPQNSLIRFSTSILGTWNFGWQYCNISKGSMYGIHLPYKISQMWVNMPYTDPMGIAIFQFQFMQKFNLSNGNSKLSMTNAVQWFNKVLQFHFDIVFQHVAEYRQQISDFNDTIWHSMLT